MQKFNTTIPLSLYIHLPWCVKKCPYCDFNSHKAPHENLPEELYINALIKDFEEHLPHIWGRRLISIFFGGGTPSLFSAGGIDKILTAIHTRLPFGGDIEITLEANPGTLDESRFAGYRKAGVNRLSLGIQSLQDEKLKLLGRIHNRDYALRAIELAQRVGFENFNLDFMFGLPEQNVEEALQDLQQGLAFMPPHLSWYQLTLEPNTLFHHQPPILPSEQIMYDIQEQGKNLLTANGMQQYEVSAYSKRGHECVHNINYWEFGDYLGIGAGAHSKLTHMDKQHITRHWQVKNPRDYLDPAKTFVAEEKILTPEETIFEFMLNALRLSKGVSADLFTERTGLPISVIEKHLKQAKSKNLLIDSDKQLLPTQLGQQFLNDLTAIFL